MDMDSHAETISTGGKLLIRLPGLSGNHTNSHLVEKQEELAKEMIKLYFRSVSHFEGFFNML
jgi:hypothetical protein